MVEAVERLQRLEDKLRQGGGAAKTARQHKAGKLTARERIHLLIDKGSFFLEVGLLIAHDQYAGSAPGAGVVTGLGKIQHRPAVVVANDATVKAGAWWPETIRKILRAQEIAMRNRIPIVYLVDSAGVHLPLQDGIFPGQYGAARIFYYNSLMRGRLHVPQISAVMGPCIAGGAYLPALSDIIYMVDKTSFMGLGGANLVKGATGQTVDPETLGGAAMHTSVSGVAHVLARDDQDCIEKIRHRFTEMPAPAVTPHGKAPSRAAEELYEILPADHRLAYNMEHVLEALVDEGALAEFQPAHASEMLCATAKLCGYPVAVIANRRGFLRAPERMRVGGILYTESARKTAYFVADCQRRHLPILYIQDISGFMVGVEAEQEGIIRAGAEMVETMACATVPKLVLTINHASGAGYYAMAGQGFDPHFTFGWPTARIGVMEGDAAVRAVHGPEMDRCQEEGAPLPQELMEGMAQTRADYERWLEATHAAARGHVDALVDPLATRQTLAFALEACLQRSRGEHLALETLA
jgi:acetyl-CoA carboxylase carboxyltransferase component